MLAVHGRLHGAAAAAVSAALNRVLLRCAVTCMISEHTGCAVHTAHTCYWDANSDGMPIPALLLLPLLLCGSAGLCRV